MAIREIVIEGDDILTKVCRPVEKFDEKLGILLDDMRETMVDADGVGLAAPQICILRRVVVIDIGEGLVELVNPEIIYEEGEQEMQEGCLSCPGVYGMTKRPAKVRVSAQNRNGERFEFEAEELFAVACCHEIDHLNGILFREHVVRMVAEDGHELS